MTIDSSGNVGIGKTPGSYALDVNGNVNATAYYGSGANLTGITVGDGTISQAKLKTAIGEVSGGSGSYICLEEHAVFIHKLKILLEEIANFKYLEIILLFIVPQQHILLASHFM